jgi:hypothetical protein
MVKTSAPLDSLIDDIRESFRAIKSSIKSSAILRRFTKYKPELPNKTRWSGKLGIVKKYCKMINPLRQFVEEEDITVDVDTSDSRVRNAQKAASMFEKIDEVTRFLQTKLLPLSSARASLDMLIEDVENNKNTPGHPLHKCRLGTSKIAPNAAIVANPDFKQAVCKIQLKQFAAMTDSEKAAAAPLRRPQAQVAAESPGTGALSFQERLAKRLKTEEQDPRDEYINCDFILGSAAEVERLWSIAGQVFPKNRANMHPIQVEALLFLRINKRFWDKLEVVEAMKRAKQEASEKYRERFAVGGDLDGPVQDI